MTEREQFLTMLDRAGLPYEERPRQQGGNYGSCGVTTVAVESRKPAGYDGGYVGIFGFDAAGELVDFGVLA